MSTDPIWMVRAGKSGTWIDDFLDKGIVGIDFGVGDLSPDVDRPEIEQRLRAEHQGAKPQAILNWAAQIRRFHQDVNRGDSVVTYDPTRRLYILGEIASESTFDSEQGWSIKQVRWLSKCPRDQLAVATRNTLGSTLTLFLIQDEAAEDLRRRALPIDAETPAEVVVTPAQESDDSEDDLLAADVANRAQEFLEDRIARLDWEQMQELVAEILRAMGYRARVSPKGGDRGVDVIASPDGLGLQEPRIFVEVKHRPGTSISSDQVRSFIGGRQPGDRCLYVSTGGFTKDARYEAERSSVPLTLVTLPDLRELVTEYYDRFSPAGAALIPLERLYWPIS
ncbi:MAG: restriction endonuclease [Planctomycetota bacterium]